VLVVEDDYDVRETIVEVLGDEGYRVVAAEDGQQAIDLLRGGLRPFAILLDLMMPVMDGHEFRQELGADAALEHIPVIVLTADRLGDQKASEMGAAAFLRKPTRLADLLETLRKFE
jgi:CheY-like chemotaxis protein